MMEGNTASFRLSIAQFYRCGMTKVVDHTNVSYFLFHFFFLYYIFDSRADTRTVFFFTRPDVCFFFFILLWENNFGSVLNIIENQLFSYFKII